MSVGTCCSVIVLFELLACTGVGHVSDTSTAEICVFNLDGCENSMDVDSGSSLAGNEDGIRLIGTKSLAFGYSLRDSTSIIGIFRTLSPLV